MTLLRAPEGIFRIHIRVIVEHATQAILTRIPARTFSRRGRGAAWGTIARERVFTVIESRSRVRYLVAVHRVHVIERNVGISALLFDILTERTRGYLIKPTVRMKRGEASVCPPARSGSAGCAAWVSDPTYWPCRITLMFCTEENMRPFALHSAVMPRMYVSLRDIHRDARIQLFSFPLSLRTKRRVWN